MPYKYLKMPRNALQYLTMLRNNGKVRARLVSDIKSSEAYKIL